MELSKREIVGLWIVLLVSFIIAYLRIDGVRGNLFKDLAHIWMGMLISPVIISFRRYWYVLIVFTVLIIVELACFFIMK